MVRDKREIAFDLEHSVGESVPDITGVGVGNVAKVGDVGDLLRVAGFKSRGFCADLDPPPIGVRSENFG